MARFFFPRKTSHENLRDTSLELGDIFFPKTLATTNGANPLGYMIAGALHIATGIFVLERLHFFS
jgi:hypothetical protein